MISTTHHRPSRRRTALRAGALAVAVLVLAPLAAIAGESVLTRSALLVGFPTPDDDGGSDVLIVPGTVIPLHGGNADPEPGGDVGEDRLRRLSGVVGGLKRTLRLGDLRVTYGLDFELEPGESRELPPPSATSALRIEVELLAAAPEAVTYRVRFSQGSKRLSDSPVTIPRGQRAVVGGVDGPDAPYLFLVLEPGKGPQPMRVTGDMTPPRALERTPPSYTEEARKERIQGIVILQATIDKTGTVTGVTTLKGLPLGLTQAAEDAVRTWRFDPARDADGKAVEVLYNLTFKFALDHTNPDGGEHRN